MKKSDLKVSLKKLTWFFEILLFCLFPFGIQAESTGNFQPPIEQIREAIIKRTHYPNQYFEINPDTGEYKDFVYIGDQKIAEINERGEINYYVNDHLGSETMVVDQRGNVIEQKDYLPYGKINSEESFADNDYGYIGKELDSETDLNYFEQRYYDSSLGKFITPDPLLTVPPKDILSDPQQLNSYSYGRGNPLRFVDKTGEKVWEFQPYLPKAENYTLGEVFGNYRGFKLFSPGHKEAKGDHLYQCTQLAKNFVSNQYGVQLGAVGNGDAYGNASNINGAIPHNQSHLGQYNFYSNGSSMMPQENDIISWSGGDYGHVGVIAEVVFDQSSGSGQIYTLEQNVKQNQVLFNYPLTRVQKDGQLTYQVGSKWTNMPIQGWARYQNQSMYNNFRPQYTSIPHTPATPMSIRRNN